MTVGVPHFFSPSYFPLHCHTTFRYGSLHGHHRGAEEFLQKLVDKIVVHEKEAIDSEITMREEIYYRFIGKVGNTDGEALRVPNMRRDNKLLTEAGVLTA